MRYFGWGYTWKRFHRGVEAIQSRRMSDPSWTNIITAIGTGVSIRNRRLGWRAVTGWKSALKSQDDIRLLTELAAGSHGAILFVTALTFALGLRRGVEWENTVLVIRES
jgi:hypothetical protein